jgi:WD40 repeat protein
MPEENVNQELSLDDIFSRLKKGDTDKKRRIRAPFKFLDSYTREDRNIFFGRDTETEEIFRKLYSGKLLLVYGKSGTGKSSIINCGLISRIPQEDIYPVNIRCSNKAYENFISEISKHSELKQNDPLEILEDIFYTRSKPVVLIFDQFEEVFILSDEEEKKKLAIAFSGILRSKLKINIILVIREEYFASLTDFEQYIPRLYDNRVRIERMNRLSAMDAIVNPCQACNVEIEEGLADRVIEQLIWQAEGLELTWLQILMDKLYRTAAERDPENPLIKIEDLDSLGRIGNVLSNFLDEQLRSMPHGDLGEAVLKAMISSDGTKKQVNIKDISETIQTSGFTPDHNLIEEILRHLINVRIITEKDDQGFFELRHDALAGRIFERMTGTEREMIEIRSFLDNSYRIYQQRKILLTEDDLNYISFYETKLILKDEIKEFIRLSRKEVIMVKQQRRNIAITAAATLIFILTCFTIWAMTERGKAVEQTVVAEKQKNEAIQANKAAEESRILALEGEKKAVENESIAVEQKKIAEEERKTAIRANIEVENSRKQALEEKNRAIENEKLATAASQQAESARIEVIKASRQAQFYLYLFNGKSLANKSLAMQENDTLRTLLAISAFDLVTYGYKNLSEEKVQPRYDAEILKSLQNAYSLFWSDSLASGEIWSLVSKNNRIVFSTGTGQITLSKLENWTAAMLPILKTETTITLPVKSMVRALANDPLSERLATGTLDGSVILTENPGSSLLVQKIIYNHNNNRVLDLTFAPGKDWLISSSTDKTIRIWDLAKQSIVKELTVDEPVQKFVLINSDHLLFVNNSGQILLWHLDDLNREPQIIYTSDNKQPIKTLAYNSEQKCLVASLSGTIMVFGISDPDLVLKLKQEQFPIKHKTVISHLEFSSDGRWLASGSADAIMLWDLNDLRIDDTGKLEPVIIENTRQLFSFGFDDKSKYLFYSDNRLLHLCPVDINEVYNRLKYLMGKKTLNEREWRYYVKGDLEKPVIK